MKGVLSKLAVSIVYACADIHACSNNEDSWLLKVFLIVLGVHTSFLTITLSHVS